MKRFFCPNCGNEIYFDNRSCGSCGKQVGYDARALVFVTLSADANGQLHMDAGSAGAPRTLCLNSTHEACNWLAADHDVYCTSCQHNRIIPDLGVPGNLEAWRALELAKRQLFYSLLRWQLPMPTRTEDPNEGLVFDVLASTVTADGSQTKVMTGHQSGLITINVAEADDATRESMRTRMREPYRTLLGHYRHEIGHYYWDRLVRDGNEIPAFRAAFGDERADYLAALQRNYTDGPRADWQSSFISSYASVHPWEDFAETWAHYIHMVDSLETARAYGMSVHAETVPGGSKEVDFRPYDAPDAKTILDAWVPFTLALNSINRSMGQRDFYPFVISGPVADKLGFIHRLVHSQQGR